MIESNGRDEGFWHRNRISSFLILSFGETEFLFATQAGKPEERHRIGGLLEDKGQKLELDFRSIATKRESGASEQKQNVSSSSTLGHSQGYSFGWSFSGFSVCAFSLTSCN